MFGGDVSHSRIAPSASAASAVAALFVDERNRDAQGVVIPRPEVHVVARFGPSTRGGLDVHAMGARATVHRKVLRRGQRAVTARLQLGAPESVLGVPASALSGRIVPLEELWGVAAARQLVDWLAAARDTAHAALVLEGALAERLGTTGAFSTPTRIALEAAQRLIDARVNTVAGTLGVSERHLRRVFRETVGISPKTFAKLARFRRALHAARQDGRAGWASIAIEAGYYDQAHLIAEFRAIAGVTPQVLLSELRAAPSVG